MYTYNVIYYITLELFPCSKFNQFTITIQILLCYDFAISPVESTCEYNLKNILIYILRIINMYEY